MICLSKAEIYDLSGYKPPKYQIDWLRKNGFTFRVGADGYPRVDRSHYLKVMGGINEVSHQKTEPNFGGLLKLVRSN